VTARIVLAVSAAALAVAAAGCRGARNGAVAQTGSTSATGGATAAIGFSRCMRAHGVSRFPDPATGGAIPKKSLDELGVSSSRYTSAQSACRSLLPNGGRPPDQAARRRVTALAVRFAQCVRAHGVPGFPDPASDGRIPDPGSVGIDQGTPKFQAANQACGAYRPPYFPSNADYDAWARTHGS